MILRSCSANFDNAFRIDDLLDAFPVHFGGGIVGLLMTPVFMYGGIIYSGGESGKKNRMCLFV